MIQNRPNIAVVRFTQFELNESKIINRLKWMGVPPVKIELKDFSTFPAPNVFIDVVSKAAYRQLAKTVRLQVQQLMKFDDDDKPHFLWNLKFLLLTRLNRIGTRLTGKIIVTGNFSGKFIADGRNDTVGAR